MSGIRPISNFSQILTAFLFAKEICFESSDQSLITAKPQDTNCLCLSFVAAAQWAMGNVNFKTFFNSFFNKKVGQKARNTEEDPSPGKLVDGGSHLAVKFPEF